MKRKGEKKMRRADGSYLNTGTITRLILAVVLFGLYFVVRGIFSGDVELSTQYAELIRAVFLLLSGALSYVPFIAAEMLLYLLIGLTALYILVMIYKMIRHGHVWARLARIASNALALASILLLLFYGLYGPAYTAQPLAERLGIETESVNTEDVHKLRTLTVYMRNQANDYANLVQRDFVDDCTFGSFETMNDMVINAFESAEIGYSVLSGPYAPVKIPYSRRLMNTLGLMGIFVPYTGEAVVNAAAPDQSIPFTMAHEMCHRLAIAREGEANFMAFIVCSESADRRANYSGYFMAYRYCISALSAVDPTAAGEVNAGVNDRLSHDLAQYKDFALSCDNWLSDLGVRVNDFYLKSQGQTEGMDSYGEMVDLLLAEFADIL